MQTTILYTPEKNLSLLPVDEYSKWTMRSTQQCHQATEDKGGLEAQRVRDLGELHGLRSKMKISAEKRQKTHFLRNNDKEGWIEDYVERETAGAIKRVEDAEAAVLQQ